MSQTYFLQNYNNDCYSLVFRGAMIAHTQRNASKRPVPSSTRNCSCFNHSCQKMTEQAFAWFWPQRPLRPAPFTDYQLSGHRSSPIQSHQGSSATVFLPCIIILIRIPCSPFPLSHFLFSTGRGRPQTSWETIQSTKSLNSLHRTQIGSPENSNNEVERIEFLLFSKVTWFSNEI